MTMKVNHIAKSPLLGQVFLSVLIFVLVWDAVLALDADRAAGFPSTNNDHKKTIKADTPRSLRGLSHSPSLHPGETSYSKDSPWWKDQFLMESVEDPLERSEIESSHRTTGTRTSGPFLGPSVKMNMPETPQRTSRIVDGEAATPHSFFAMLLTRKENEWLWSGCGGTLISDCHVLTAAHCLAETAVPVHGIMVNAYSPFSGNNSNIPFHFSTIRRTETHPNFVLPTNEADVAILHMERCLDVNVFPPALLADNNEQYAISRRSSVEPQLTVQVLGLGSMNDSGMNPAESLRQVMLPFIPRKDCRRYYNEEVLNDMVCAGYADTGGPDACQGDSGGGMVHYRTENRGGVGGPRAIPYLLGVVSWGVGCGRKDYPGVYIYIPYYREWILERICPSSWSAVSSRFGFDGSNQRPWCEGNTGFGESTTEAIGIASQMPTIPPSSQPHYFHSTTTQSQPTSLPQTAYSQTAHPQPTPQEEPDDTLCLGEGQICKVSADCCSAFCRGFAGVGYKICSGSYPSTYSQQQSQQSQSYSTSEEPMKTGGAGGAKGQRSSNTTNHHQ